MLPFAQSRAPPDALRAMLQQIVRDATITEYREEIGAARYARSPERQGERAGLRDATGAVRSNAAGTDDLLHDHDAPDGAAHTVSVSAPRRLTAAVRE